MQLLGITINAEMTSTDRKILQLALPSIVSNITVPLLGLCDVTIMGHVGGAAHIGAITVGSMVFNVMYWLFGFLRMGTSGLTAQAWGGRHLTDVTAMLWRGLGVGIGLGLLIVVLQVPIGRLAFWLMQPTDEVVRLCTPYYYIGIWGAPAVLGLYALTGWFIGMQNTRTPMLIAIAQNVANIALSLLLVVGLEMGVEGVAIGTVTAQWLGFLTALLLLLSRYGKLLRRHRAGLRSMFSRLGHFFRLNLDIFMRTVCLVAVNLYFTSAGAAQGALILAANALLMQLFMLFSYVMDGFAYAGEALAGRYYGAGNDAMLRHTVKRLFRWGVGVAVVFTLLYGLGGEAFLSLLTTDDRVTATARTFLPWAVLIPAAGMAAFVWDGVFIGLTATRDMLVACLVASVVFFAVCLSLFTAMGNHALWLALLLYLALRGIVQTVIASASLLRPRADRAAVADGNCSNGGRP